MKRWLLLVALGLLALTGACASPLSSLRSDLEHRSALLAGYAPPETETPACVAGVKRLEATAVLLLIDVQYVDLPVGFGFANREARIITISRELTACGRLETLAHEIGHFLQPHGLSGPEGQVFADGVSYLVVRQLGGYDPKGRYAAYLAAFKPSGRVLTLLQREIEITAGKVVSGHVTGVDLR